MFLKKEKYTDKTVRGKKEEQTYFHLNGRCFPLPHLTNVPLFERKLHAPFFPQSVHQFHHSEGFLMGHFPALQLPSERARMQASTSYS